MIVAEYLASNRGYAYYELGRALWHYLHWLTVPVVMAAAVVIEFAVTHFRGGGG